MISSAVASGQWLLVVEAMKMENDVAAPRVARVAQVAAGEGQTVEQGQPPGPSVAMSKSIPPGSRQARAGAKSGTTSSDRHEAWASSASTLGRCSSQASGRIGAFSARRRQGEKVVAIATGRSPTWKLLMIVSLLVSMTQILPFSSSMPRVAA